MFTSPKFCKAPIPTPRHRDRYSCIHCCFFCFARDLYHLNQRFTYVRTLSMETRTKIPQHRDIPPLNFDLYRFTAHEKKQPTFGAAVLGCPTKRLMLSPPSNTLGCGGGGVLCLVPTFFCLPGGKVCALEPYRDKYSDVYNDVDQQCISEIPVKFGVI